MSIKKYYNFAKHNLFNLNRSIISKDTKLTLKLIQKKFPTLKIKFLRSQEKIFDWKIPNERNIKDT